MTVKDARRHAVQLTTIRYDVDDDGVGTVTLDRPEALNAATYEMEAELLDVVGRADADPGVRALVLTGAGRGFCAGDDVKKAWGDPRMEATLAELAGPTPPMTPLVARMLRTETPVVAAVNGVALGIGMDLALLCDVRLASEHAKFGQLFVTMGLSADVTGYWVLPQLVGAARAAELLLTGQIVDAELAARIGLVSRVVPAEELLPAAHQLAARIAANPPLAVRAIKKGLRLAHGRRADELQDVATYVGHSLARLFATDDHKEAVAAFVEHRSPTFRGG
jgi:enoyl-CoA hydratase/carnithine racemase